LVARSRRGVAAINTLTDADTLTVAAALTVALALTDTVGEASGQRRLASPIASPARTRQAPQEAELTVDNPPNLERGLQAKRGRAPRTAPKRRTPRAQKVRKVAGYCASTSAASSSDASGAPLSGHSMSTSSQFQ
jgi:hypothetical protein